MKNSITTIAVSLLLITGTSCSTQSPMQTAKTSALLQTGEFTFVAERANPTNFDVINVLNSLPGGSAGRVLNLDAGYTIEMKKEVLEVTLPYFGRMYTSNLDPDKNSYRFTSKDYSVDRSSGKKGSSVYILMPNDQRNIRRITMEVFKNGKAYVAIDSNDRQPISYDGYVTNNLPVKN